MWDARIIETARSRAEVIFRVPCHLVIHEWIKEIGVAYLIFILFSEVFGPLLCPVGPLRLEASGCQCLEANHDQYPSQPNEEKIAKVNLNHRSLLFQAGDHHI